MPYLKALSREIGGLEGISIQTGVSLEQIAGLNVDTIYFGGGTPSFIAGEQLLELMTRIRQSSSLPQR